jgi:hypothetical protein
MANLAPAVAIAIGVVGAAGAAAVTRRRQVSTFAVSEAAATQLPWSAPTRTVLTVTLDAAHVEARPRITALRIVDADRRPRPEFTFAGDDAVRLREGALVLAGAEDETTITVEVLRDGQSGVFDLDGLYVELMAGRSAGKVAEIRVIDPG